MLENPTLEKRLLSHQFIYTPLMSLLQLMIIMV